MDGTNIVNGIAMAEVREGYYEGTWRAPEDFAATNLIAEVIFQIASLIMIQMAMSNAMKNR